MKLPISAILLASAMALTSSCTKTAPTTAQQPSTTDASSGSATAPGSATRANPTLSTRTDAPGTPNGAPNGASSSPAPAPQPIRIPSGTPLTVTLQAAISSATAQPGDRFRASLNAPLRVDGQTVAATGTEVSGKVVAAERSGRLENPGMLQIELSSIQVGGKPVAISTSSVTERGASHKKRNIGWIGGGAGAGAVLGGIFGGGKGALIGSAAGAGAGTATAAATGKHDVAFNVERPLTFRLRQQVEVQ